MTGSEAQTATPARSTLAPALRTSMTRKVVPPCSMEVQGKQTRLVAKQSKQRCYEKLCFRSLNSLLKTFIMQNAQLEYQHPEACSHCSHTTWEPLLSHLSHAVLTLESNSSHAGMCALITPHSNPCHSEQAGEHTQAFTTGAVHTRMCV
jgi:hypothetical protein